MLELQSCHATGNQSSAAFELPSRLAPACIHGLIKCARARCVGVPGISSWDCFAPAWPSSCATCLRIARISADEIRYRQSQQDAELFAQALLALPVECQRR